MRTAIKPPEAICLGEAAELELAAEAAPVDLLGAAVDAAALETVVLDACSRQSVS